jgi:hypothetical protein
MIHAEGNAKWVDIGARTLEVLVEELQSKGGSHRLLTMVVPGPTEPVPEWEAFTVDAQGIEAQDAETVQEWRAERLAQQERAR